MNYPYLVSFKRSLFSLIFSCLFFGLAFAFGLPTLGLPILSQPAFGATEPATKTPATDGPITISPRDDFPGWYAQWEKNVPQNYRSTFTVYKKYPNKTDWVTKYSKRVREPFELHTSMDTAGDGSCSFKGRFIQNENYCAILSATGKDKLRWTIESFSTKKQHDYLAQLSKMQTRYGGQKIRIFGPKLELFRGGTIAESSESGKEGKRIKKIVYTFDVSKEPSNSPLPKKITLLLDESIGWYPVETLKQLVDGSLYRHIYSDWQLTEGVLRCQHVKSFSRGSKKSKEKLWLIATLDYQPKIRDISTECYLSHYGLPEPEVSGEGNYTWWLMLLTAVLLSGGGYHLLKRQE